MREDIIRKEIFADADLCKYVLRTYLHKLKSNDNEQCYVLDLP